MSTRVEELDSRRLVALQEQAALYGPQTDPAVLIEIAELRGKGRSRNSPEGGRFVNSLDFDLVRTSVAAALIRIGVIETNQAADQKNRWLRQLVHDLWMIAITIMVFVILIMQLAAK